MCELMERQQEWDELEKNQMRKQMEMLRKVMRSRVTGGVEDETDGKVKPSGKAHRTG